VQLEADSPKLPDKLRARVEKRKEERYRKEVEAAKRKAQDEVIIRMAEPVSSESSDDEAGAKPKAKAGKASKKEKLIDHSPESSSN
jgi:hypothetical protein